MRLLYPEYLYLLFFLPVFWWMEFHLETWRKRMRADFAEPGFHFTLFPVYANRQRFMKGGLWSLAFCAMVLALARPQGQPVCREQIEQNMAVYIVLDCSLSMRAQDVSPSRLRAAKTAIRMIIDELPHDRIGLITFAGEARVVCPATYDHHTFLNALHYVNTNTLRRAGSNPTAGLRLAMEKLVKLSGKAKVAIILSDGEANQSSSDLTVIGRKASQLGIKIFSIGFGSLEGSVIPVGKDFWGQHQYRKFRGQLVKSRLVSLGLRKVAKLSGGRYFYWQTLLQTPKVVSAALRGISRDIMKKAKVIAYYEYFPWLAGLAFCLLMLEWIIPFAGRRRV